jgi:hypothetical protein
LPSGAGLPDGIHIFKPKNPNLGKFWSVLQWKMFVYLVTILSILRPFGIFCGHLVYFMVVWYIFSPFWYDAARKIWQPWSGAQLDKDSATPFTDLNARLLF